MSQTFNKWLETINRNHYYFCEDGTSAGIFDKAESITCTNKYAWRIHDEHSHTLAQSTELTDLATAKQQVEEYLFTRNLKW